MRKRVAGDAAARPARARSVVRDNPRLELMAIYDYHERKIIPGLRRVEGVRIACCCLRAGKLDRECHFLCVCELMRIDIESDRPIVDFAAACELLRAS
jgi:hypothetical protein